MFPNDGIGERVRPGTAVLGGLSVFRLDVDPPEGIRLVEEIFLVVVVDGRAIMGDDPATFFAT